MNDKYLLICPFCDECGFDKIGLKYHLLHYCEIYDKIPITTLYDYKLRKGLII